jgi:hypothetical protein
MATAIEEIVERCLAEIEHRPDGRGQGFPSRVSGTPLDRMMVRDPY